MIEANDDIELTTTRLLEARQSSRKDYQKAVTEGRLIVRPERTTNAKLEVATNATLPAPDAAGAIVRESGTTSVPLPASNPDVTWRYTRLAITAGLVVLLFFVWIWQKKRVR